MKIKRFVGIIFIVVAFCVFLFNYYLAVMFFNIGDGTNPFGNFLINSVWCVVNFFLSVRIAFWLTDPFVDFALEKDN